jgi:hypothetical protein
MNLFAFNPFTNDDVKPIPKELIDRADILTQGINIDLDIPLPINSQLFSPYPSKFNPKRY